MRLIGSRDLSSAVPEATASGTVSFATRRGRPPFRWADVFKAPLHDYPIRDEILFQHLAFEPSSRILEVGPGSGFTAFRLAPHVRHITLLDVSKRAIDELRHELHDTPNLDFVCADITAPALASRLQRRFDTAFALDMFEYVQDPAACLRNLAAVLRPGGQLLLTFPNVPPPLGDGVTWFTDLSDLERMVAAAGFGRWEIFAVRPGRFAATVYGALHEWPLRAYRRLRARHTQTRPQIYEATWAFQHRGRLARAKGGLHVYWALIDAALQLGGNVFVAEPVREPLGRQLVIRATR
jgi:SAM-dependent methyltransferase